MRPITRIGLALLLALGIFMFAPDMKEAKASGPYTFDSASGYYIGSGGGYYSRTKVYYYQNCRRYYYWRYNPVSYSPPAPAAQYITPGTENWRQRLLDIAANRDKYEAAQRTSALEHSEFLEAVKALGLTGNFHWQSYGMAPQLASNAYSQSQYSHQAYSQQPTVQGSTIYGYSTVADVYGDVDLGALYQQALRLGEQAQTYGAAAARDSKALIAQEGENRARVAAVLAEAQAVREKLDAARPTTQQHIRTHQFKIEIPGNGTAPKVTPLESSQSSGGTSSIQGGAGVSNALVNLVQNKCVSCHGGDKTDGGLDLRDLSQLTAEQGTSVLERIVHPDPDKRMPKSASPLTIEERLLFFAAASPGPASKD